MNTLTLDIVTPNGSVYKEDNVEIVVLQTTARRDGCDVRSHSDGYTIAYWSCESD